MSGGIRHPFTRAIYERDADGAVVVRDGEMWGRFTRYGQWIEGDLREADPHLCGWIAGRQFANHRVIESVPSSGQS